MSPAENGRAAVGGSGGAAADGTRGSGPGVPAGSVAVVAAVVRRGDRYLVGRRPEEKRHGGLWEFPGGKIHAGEDMLAAADRELDEELGMRAVALGGLLLTSSDGSSPFVIHFVEIQAEGEPEAREHSELGWYTPDELARLPLAPADARFVATLKDPA